MQGDKFILDTNIWLSSIITSGLIDLTAIIQGNNLQVYISHDITDELSNNLRKKKFKKYLTRSSNEYLSLIHDLSILTKAEKVFKESPDPNDNFLFDLAIKIKANYLVTGDKLLFQTKIPGTLLITLREFKDMF